MADSSVPITAGSGTNIDTQVPTGGDHRQVVVIGDPNTIGGVAPVDATFGLEVDVSRVVPGVGATHLGKAEDSAHADGDTGVMMLGVRNHFSGSTTDGDYSALSVGPYGDLNTLRRADLQRITVSVAGRTTATTGYTAGDQVGTIITLASAARISGGSGIITSATLIDTSDVIGAYDLLIFDSSVTLTTDNLPFALSTASDSLKIQTIIQLAGAVDLGTQRVAQATNLAIPYTCSGSSSLFAALITRSTHTFFGSTSTLQLAVAVERY